MHIVVFWPVWQSILHSKSALFRWWQVAQPRIRGLRIPGLRDGMCYSILILNARGFYCSLLSNMALRVPQELNSSTQMPRPQLALDHIAEVMEYGNVRKLQVPAQK